MAYNLVRKGGIPVLAYPTSNAAAPSSCSLVIKYSETHMQATISLQVSTLVHGFDEEQRFTLLYHADNLVPGTISLGPATISPVYDRLNEIRRQGNPKPRTLSLTLKEPCPIRCPHSSGSIAPKNEAVSRQLVDLARSTEIQILFDYNWLHRDKHARLERLIHHSEYLSGFQSGDEKLYRQADWTVFSPIEDVFEALPSYNEVSNKRPRQAATSSSPEPPHPKRALLSSALSIALSPTEKATTLWSPSPKPPSSPLTNAPDFQQAVKNAVETLLPEALQTILPDMLPRLFVVPSPSPSPSQVSQSSNPTPNPTNTLRTLMSARLAAHAEAQLQKIHTDTLDHAAYLRDAADVEFLEEVIDHKLDVIIAKNDGIAELNGKLDEFRESAAEIVKEVQEHAELAYADVCERLDGLVDVERACLVKEKEALEGEKRRWEDRWRGAEKGVIAKEKGRRAMSLPL